MSTGTRRSRLCGPYGPPAGTRGWVIRAEDPHVVPGGRDGEAGSVIFALAGGAKSCSATLALKPENANSITGGPLPTRHLTRAAIDKVLETADVDLLVTGEQAYAPAGYPAITVPGGYSKDAGPTGPVFVGPRLPEPRLITAAFM